MIKKQTPHPYELYEIAVQDTELDLNFMEETFIKTFKRKPKLYREDFCGTFKQSVDWVKRSENNRALCLDIDSKPLEYGKKVYFEPLTKEQKERLCILQRNVISVTSPKADMMSACNFSYWIFKERDLMKSYFKKAFQSLKSKGAFYLDMVGGTGMQEAGVDRHTYKIRRKKFDYLWEQKNFNPVKNEAKFSIHFQFPGHPRMLDVFTYDWRVWSIPEIRDLLKEVGFSEVHVYWEVDKRKAGGKSHFFERREKEDPAHVWIAYVVGVKK